MKSGAGRVMAAICLRPPPMLIGRQPTEPPLHAGWSGSPDRWTPKTDTANFREGRERKSGPHPKPATRPLVRKQTPPWSVKGGLRTSPRLASITETLRPCLATWLTGRRSTRWRRRRDHSHPLGRSLVYGRRRLQTNEGRDRRAALHACFRCYCDRSRLGGVAHRSCW